MATDNDNMLTLRVQLLEQELKKLQAIVKKLTKEKSFSDHQLLNESAQQSEDAILNIEEANKLLKLPLHIIYKKSKSGELPSFRIGKQYKFKRSELIQWKQMQVLGKRQNLDEYVNKYLQKKIVNG